MYNKSPSWIVGGRLHNRAESERMWCCATTPALVLQVLRAIRDASSLTLPQYTARSLFHIGLDVTYLCLCRLLYLITVPECRPHTMISSSRYLLSKLAVPTFTHPRQLLLIGDSGASDSAFSFRILTNPRSRCRKVVSTPPFLRRCMDTLVHHHHRYRLQDPYH